ncbi:MAG: biotin/lipoyl-containing protein [Pseudomonadota bacterium]
MGEAGRKLTIRMPDNPRLKSAEVARVHVDVGNRAQVGSPIMTLVARRREHMIRAPRPGRIVPLVAPGDKVQPGEPLFILNLDEAALAEVNRDQNALVPIEKTRWTPPAEPEVIEPVARMRAANDVDWSGLRVWGKPILAIALYVLACFALLPILNAFGQNASPWLLGGMVAGCIAFAYVIFRLYAPDSGVWQRRTVRLVATSWLGISLVAIFSQARAPEEISIASLSDSVLGIFGPEDPGTAGPELAAAPIAAPNPPAVTASGVLVGWIAQVSRPRLTDPVSVFAADAGVSAADGVTPHGVSVNEWARSPVEAEGASRVDFVGLDLPIASLPVAGEVPQWSGLTALGEPAGLPVGLPAEPVDFALAQISLAGSAPADDGREGNGRPLGAPEAVAELSAVGLTTVMSIAPGADDASVLDPAQTGGNIAAPAAPVASVIFADLAAAWLSTGTVPVIYGQGAPDIAATGLAVGDRDVLVSDLPALMFAAQVLGATNNPDPILPVIQRAGDEIWVAEQSERLALLPAEAGLLIKGVAAVSRETAETALSAVDLDAPGTAEAAAAAIALGHAADPLRTEAIAVVRHDAAAFAPPPVDFVALMGAVPADPGAAIVATIAGLPETGNPDPVLPLVELAGDAVWLEEQSGRLAASKDRPMPAFAALGQVAPRRVGRTIGQAGSDDSEGDLAGALDTAKARSTDWVAETALPVIESDASPVVELVDKAWQSAKGVGGATAVAGHFLPRRLSRTGNPDPNLVLTLRSGRQEWMRDQARALESVETVLAGQAPISESVVSTELLAALDPALGPALGQGTATDGPGPTSLAMQSQLAVVNGRQSPQPVADSLTTGSDWGARPDGAKIIGAPPAIKLARRPDALPDRVPWQPAPVVAAERVLVFLFYDDPRMDVLPGLGDEWRAMVSPDLQTAITSSIVEEVQEIVQINAWCSAAAGAGDPEAADYRTAQLGDRIRLLQVRVQLSPAMVPALETELPVFGGGQPGFFHNRHPLLGSADTSAMDRARAYVTAISNAGADVNTPPGVEGGHFYDSGDAALLALTGAGCTEVEWNDGDGPVNRIGAQLSDALRG